MQGTHFSTLLHIAGTLSGTATRKYVLPFNASLIGFQITAVANTNSELDLGNSGDGDAYIDGLALANSGDVLTKSAADFIGGKALHLAKGTTIVASVTKGSTSAADVSLYLLFTEG